MRSSVPGEEGGVGGEGYHVTHTQGSILDGDETHGTPGTQYQVDLVQLA